MSKSFPRQTHARLVPFDERVIAALNGDPSDLERWLQVRFESVLETVREVAQQTASFLAKSPRPAPWGAYLAADAISGQVVGTCAFVSAPADNGTVEIAYYTFPSFEGRGYATAMAAELVRIAHTARADCLVIACTLPQNNASTRVLEKNGFRNTGDFNHPEDGRVWRWAKDSSRPART